MKMFQCFCSEGSADVQAAGFTVSFNPPQEPWAEFLSAETFDCRYNQAHQRVAQVVSTDIYIVDMFVMCWTMKS